MNSTLPRLASVDSFRVLAMLAVIAIHTVPFSDTRSIGNELNLAIVINQLARFAVPFFFVASGYFWSKKISTSDDILGSSKKTAKRILALFVLWSLAYVCITGMNLLLMNGRIAFLKEVDFFIDALIHRPVTSLLQGSKAHLWFLPALLISLLLTAYFLEKNRLRALVIVAIGLYTVGLLGGAYNASPLGINTQFNFRNGPFFGLLFFVAGHVLQQLKPTHSWFIYGFALTLAALVLQFLELNYLFKTWGTSLRQDYVVSTFFVGMGVSMMALSNHPRLRWDTLSGVGPIVLGVYAVHYVFVDLFAFRHHWTGIGWVDDIFYVIAVFALSTVAAFAMSRLSITKPLVA
ncbi:MULTISPECIES: acyltransferase [unclassified Massilia]|uniref:acyltransferase n=1 Tax=unclassified Massilia TaxID=2609279 RepID=UPI001783D383|nr:acyltransferase [Massilia sp. CFBP 13647]MBD8674402.1 acyltransferase [Massilia sp. CFBP 13721]